MGNNTLRIIGIAGPAGSGKDTAGQHLVTQHGYRRKALADPVKELLSTRFGWTMEQWSDRQFKEGPSQQCGHHAAEGYESELFSPRTWAQWLGTEAGRAVHGEDCWVKLLMQQWQTDGKPLTVVTDVRFNNEAYAIRLAGGVIIHLVRAGTAPIAEHVSELPILRAESDVVIYNCEDIGYFQDELDAAMHMLSLRSPT